MSTDRAELSADDFAAVLGGKQRLREAKMQYLTEQWFLYARTLGQNSKPARYAFAMLMNMHERMLKEAA